MNAISALNQYLSPELRALPGGAIPGKSAPIPASELQALAPSDTTGAVSAPAGKELSFGSFLGHLVEDVNARQTAATATANSFLSGQNVSLHQTMIALEEANVSFQLMVEVRNRLLESYQELMRMQV